MLNKQHTDGLDTLLIGGGLANALIALALAKRDPGRRVVLLEAAERVGGNHTWCFHQADIPSEAESFVAPLVVQSWEAYDVAFPGRRRTLRHSYAATTGERVDAYLREVFAGLDSFELVTAARVSEVSGSEVRLANGQTLRAKQVIDGRGPEAMPPLVASAYQKFVGLELELSADAPKLMPTIMDAELPQIDGFRFVYVLPFSARRVLIEDTYFSLDPALDVDIVRDRVLDYARERGFSVQAIRRQEQGIIPLPLRMSHPTAGDRPFRSGLAGGWFHPTTGYSFPVGVRLALALSGLTPDFDPSALEQHCSDLAKQQRFALFLNRLLYGAFEPADRWNVLERFYGLPDETILRFYALTTTAKDRARILCGRPPRGLSLKVALSSGATA